MGVNLISFSIAIACKISFCFCERGIISFLVSPESASRKVTNLQFVNGSQGCLEFKKSFASNAFLFCERYRLIKQERTQIVYTALTCSSLFTKNGLIFTNDFIFLNASFLQRLRIIMNLNLISGGITCQRENQTNMIFHQIMSIVSMYR